MGVAGDGKRSVWDVCRRTLLLGDDGHCVIADRRERGLFRPAAVARLLDDHAQGRIAAGDRIWALLNLELWYRTFIDGDGIQTLPAPSKPAVTGLEAQDSRFKEPIAQGSRS